jgi:hypothetical protein
MVTNSVNQFYNTNDKKKDNFEMNIIDCSIIDLKLDSKTPKNLQRKMTFNDDPTEFNMEMNILPPDDEPNINTTFQNEGDYKEDEKTPIILRPIVNTELTQNYINK